MHRSFKRNSTAATRCVFLRTNALRVSTQQQRAACFYAARSDLMDAAHPAMLSAHCPTGQASHNTLQSHLTFIMFDEPSTSMATTTSTPTRTWSSTTTADVSPRRVKIYFQDDEVRRRSEEVVRHLLSSAVNESASGSDNSTLLAKKALRYRKVLGRMTGVDVTSPEFDASKFLGVDWCKTQSLQAHCLGLH